MRDAQLHRPVILAMVAVIMVLGLGLAYSSMGRLQNLRMEEEQVSLTASMQATIDNLLRSSETGSAIERSFQVAPGISEICFADANAPLDKFVSAELARRVTDGSVVAAKSG
ncbi:hypothetical protein COV94_01195, partial [Candidatus Woesearchaeota archaeon CG11_big_fil_rev_8_21_14_0_20_57_5]